jgi:hypothetical protein
VLIAILISPEVCFYAAACFSAAEISMSCPEVAVVGRGGELSWANKSSQSIARRGTRGGAILIFSGLSPKDRRVGSGCAFASYKGLVEMKGESGAVVGCVE